MARSVMSDVDVFLLGAGEGDVDDDTVGLVENFVLWDEAVVDGALGTGEIAPWSGSPGGGSEEILPVFGVE